jgi:hypothetical protein
MFKKPIYLLGCFLLGFLITEGVSRISPSAEREDVEPAVAAEYEISPSGLRVNANARAEALPDKTRNAASRTSPKASKAEALDQEHTVPEPAVTILDPTVVVPEPTVQVLDPIVAPASHSDTR